MSKTQWTKEIPTEDGWYWIYFGDVSTGKIIEYVKNGELWSYTFAEWQAIQKSWDISFYGPIEEPK